MMYLSDMRHKGQTQAKARVGVCVSSSYVGFEDFLLKLWWEAWSMISNRNADLVFSMLKADADSFGCWRVFAGVIDQVE